MFVHWNKRVDAQLRQPLFVTVQPCRHPIKWPVPNLPTLHQTPLYFPQCTKVREISQRQILYCNVGRSLSLNCENSGFSITKLSDFLKFSSDHKMFQTLSALLLKLSTFQPTTTAKNWSKQNWFTWHQACKANKAGEDKRMSNVYTALYSY